MAGEALARHIATYPPLPDGSLFYGENGRVWSQRRYGVVFSAAVARLAARGFPADTTSHKLRHTFASWVLHVTGDPVWVAKLLGHENATLVLKVYGHLLPGADDRARRAVDAAWRQDRADQAGTGGVR